MTEPSHIDYGALVGWTSTMAGDRMTLHLQSVTKPPPHEADDVHSHVYMMDRNQAAQLANYLFEVCDLTKPDGRNRSMLKRLFG